MLNIFYIYGLLWSLILVLYNFGWSDLCIDLSPGVMFFVIFQIAVSFILGYIFRRKFKFYKIEKNPHNKKTVTILLVIFFIINILYERYLPILSVITGNSMYAEEFSGFPVLYLLASGFAIIYSFYLFYLYICFKETSILIEYLVILLWFILLFQRQNIFVILGGALWLYVASFDFEKLNIKKKILLFITVFILASLGLYIFGIIGNIRYGIWDWNDSSMICVAARINEKWPKGLSKIFVWAYIYLVSPLANLQFNCMNNVLPNVNFMDILSQFLPTYIKNNVGISTSINQLLLVSALNVCTAFSIIYRAAGWVGVYILYFFELLILIIEIKGLFNRKKLFIPFCIGWGYFYLMNFFVNPLSYAITSLMIVYPMFLFFRLGFKFKFKFK